MKDSKEPIAFQLVARNGDIHSTHPTYAKADHEATSVFWLEGKTLEIVEVYS
tara:strand:- start:930 stop:1085 length:156 start_codon:yes stop_codon:yes gene_type:complete